MVDAVGTLENTRGIDTEALPRPLLELSHRFYEELPELCVEWEPEGAADPQLVVLNKALANELGLDAERCAASEGISVFSGNRVPPGAVPVALGYAGHQFGAYSPRLGDGRALLLGELADSAGRLVDVHLKGSGRTPFARGGDGRATIGPMLREYVVSEALHALRIPTTRSLAVVTTGDSVYRNRAEPGAVLTRTAASHVRVGTFEYAVRLGGDDLVRRLADHVIARHHPHAADAGNPYRELLDTVVDVQASLVARWMLVGFIHGVMNTDNMTISGEGIDYGPCAFMDRYDPATVYSSIDHAGRYSYGNQAAVAAWNLARFAETLLGLVSDDADEAVEIATASVNAFRDRFDEHWRAGMATKLGLGHPGDSATADGSLLTDLPEVVQADRADWTLTFRRLAGELRGPRAAAPGGFLRAHSEAMTGWIRRWLAALGLDRTDLGAERACVVADAMDRVNPLYVPRNHLVHEALEAANDGDLAPLNELTAVLEAPFDARPGHERFAEPASEEFDSGFRTFCGT